MTLATISIVSHGHGAMLHDLLTDLIAQQGIEDCQVVITLNLANECIDPALYPNLTLTVLSNPTPKGFGANHNAAFAHCDAPWFIVMNPDIRLPDPSTLQHLAGNAPAVGDGLLAPVVVNSRGLVEDSVRLNISPWSLLRRVLGQRQRYQPDGPAWIDRPFYWLAGMCMVVNAEPYRAMRGFDERFFLYCEDYDLCARLYLAGYKINILNDVRVIHDAQRDSHRSLAHLRQHLVSLVKAWSSVIFWRIVLADQRRGAAVTK